jgi:formylglycine-generating enzyme required for sulfatase activity/serine/threonine protein kinase
MPEPNPKASAVSLGRAYEILEEGKTFGPYVIVRCLGYDMLGGLYLTLNQETNQRETLFVFPSLVSQDTGFGERFTHQVLKLGALQHPNLLSFTHALTVDQYYCLAGEAFEGLSIPDHLMMLTGSQLSVSESQQAVNLPPAQVTPILEQVLAGLAYAHENKVMHLNLNPTKILRSNFGEVKVYGYHFLSILGQELFEMLVSAGIPPLKLDPRRSFLGPTDVLSPEARLRQTLEYRSDIYAIGVDTHWLLTGRKPVSPYQPPSQLLPGIEPGWDALIMRCLQRKPDDRYASAGAVLVDLRNLAELTPVASKQPLELMLAPEPAAAPTPPAPKKKGGSKSPIVKTKAPPLPKGQRKARKPLTKVQRLLYIGLPSLLAVALACYLYVVLETGDEDELSAQGSILAVRATEGQTPRLRLTVTPRNALVTITPGKNVFEISDGELPLNIAKGDYIIDVESPRHRPVRMPYTVQGEPDHVFINLDPNWAIVDFTSVPGATLVAQPDHGSAVTLGVADGNGTLHVTKGLSDGNYTFIATKQDYVSMQLPPQALELTHKYAFTLKPVAKPSTITLASEPPGATVMLGQRALGRTPLTTQDIPVDTDVTISLQLQGYQTVERTLHVRPDVTDQIDLGNLAAKMGELAVSYTLGGKPSTAEQLRDTKITINNREYPGSLRRLPNMLEGVYTVTVEHPNYFPHPETITITEGKTATVAEDLQPRPVRLEIHASPAVPITVYLNDQPLAPSPDGTYPLPPDQADQVRVEAQNYAGAAREFKFGPNHTETWEVPLQVLAPPKIGENYQIPYLNMQLHWIPPGTYTMGSPSEETERKSTEGPQTVVTFPAGFWAGVYDVTQDEYQSVTDENPSEFGHDQPNQGRYPVESVSWNDAMNFARLVNEREQAAGRVPAGYEFRLPTEAEWEYFARAGTTTAFNFGDKADPTMGNFKGTYPSGGGSELTSSDLDVGTKPVGSYAPNAWGLYDIHGNVAEWVFDAYKSRLPGGNVTAPALVEGDNNAPREYRGGDWKDYARDARSAWRDNGVRPDTVSNSIGLRLVLAPKITPTNP